jgi:hypothetical protein
VFGALGAAAFVCTASAHAAPSDAAILADKPPKLLSEFGFFADPKAQKPVEGLIPYDLNTPLFSDGAL